MKKEIKFTQIAANDSELFALGEDGKVYKYLEAHGVYNTEHYRPPLWTGLTNWSSDNKKEIKE